MARRGRRYFASVKELKTGEIINLSPEEAHHFLHVLRGQAGEELILFCCDGTEALSRCIDLSKKGVRVEVGPLEKPVREWPFSLEILVVFGKGNQAEEIVDGLTQLGVSHIQPIQSRRAVYPVEAKKIERLRRTVIEACKQCGRNHLPTLGEAISLETALARKKGFSVLLDPEATSPLATLSPGNATHLQGWIGPEGGWTEEELTLFATHQIQGATLAPAILRTEVAVLAFAAEAAALMQRLSPNQSGMP